MNQIRTLFQFTDIRQACRIGMWVRTLGWFVAALACLSGMVPTSLLAQDLNIDGWKVIHNRPFHDVDGNEILTGHFMGLVDGRVHLMNAAGDEKKLRLEEFSEADRDWIRGEIAAQKQRDSDREKVIKIRTQLSVGNNNTVISNCKKLRTIGRNAEIATDELNRLVTNHGDELVKMEAFVAYVAVARVDSLTVEFILNALNNQWMGVMGRLERKPEDFLNEMAGFGELAVPYLQHVAAIGLLKPPKVNEPFTRGIQELATDDQPSWRVRNAAIAALGKISSEETLLLVLDHLNASGQVADRQRVHQQNLEACLNAIGTIRIDNEDVQAALDQYSADFPKVVERVRDLLKK